MRKRSYKWDGYLFSLNKVYHRVLLDNEFIPFKNGYKLETDAVKLYVSIEQLKGLFQLSLYSYNFHEEIYEEKLCLKVIETIKKNSTNIIHTGLCNNQAVTASIKDLNLCFYTQLDELKNS